MDIAPATKPATPASNMLLLVAPAAATPRIKLAVEIIPSFAPSTAARSQPIRPTRCASLCTRRISYVPSAVPQGHPLRDKSLPRLQATEEQKARRRRAEGLLQLRNPGLPGMLL